VKDVVTAVLGGGQGTRLWPLTKFRAKPAVPLAGKFRLVDVAISNSLHAGIERIFVLTQFNSASLHRHIAQTYRFDVFSSGFVQILAAEQSVGNREWYQGTADAVRQNLPRLVASGASEVVILSGDQLYLMDLEALVRQHREKNADMTIAVKPVSRAEAPELGVLRVNSDGRLVRFVEKPTDESVLDELALDAKTIESAGLDAEPDSVLASMGIYVFRMSVLKELLESGDDYDFGKQIIPQSMDSRGVYGFLHNGYWRDIGTIPGFHEASLELTWPVPPLDFYNPERPVFTHPRFLPGAKVTSCQIEESILCDGSQVSGCRFWKVIAGVRSVVRAGAELEESIIMGCTEEGAARDQNVSPVGIGNDCRLRRAIVDFDASVGEGAQLLNEAGVEEADEENYSIRGGIIVVPRRAVIPPGTVI
jgi:glucose-1-phosphate adenylyltransferase